IQGADAACVNCHQHSGLGAREGNKSIPPITARYLTHPRASRYQDLDLPYVDGIRADRDPYTDATIARAIRDGLNSEGQPLGYLMPHFALGDADMTALIAYLKRLDQRTLPGVTDTVLHFATIITPDADPVKRRGMLDVLEHFFADKNAFTRGPSPRLLSTHIVKFKANRRWQLHVWQLTGAPDTWQAQLRRHLADEPVLAVISGLGGRTWAPVHAFCEQAAVPCLFPNVDAPPPDADRDFYSVYFSKGVLLEAGLIAQGILKPDSGSVVKRVQQIYRAGDSGEAGAQALAEALGQRGIKVENHVLARGKPGQGLAAAMRGIPGADALVLWLRPQDIAALDKLPPPTGSVFMSGLLGGLDDAPLPASWRDRTRLAYPVGLPQQRLINLDFALGWFRIRQIPVVDLRVQADTYLACGLLSEALSHMVDTFVRDYLVENIQNMVEHRIITGYYPRLSLAAGQRFASKGGYLARFDASRGARVIDDQGWLVPPSGTGP
ncbi:MAG TPA: c-type cytochrome, partial [Steroidobacteraceae bacterium]|nr:c-type cytochrome [Steroidobacteraceae bacterium]